MSMARAAKRALGRGAQSRHLCRVAGRNEWEPDRPQTRRSTPSRDSGRSGGNGDTDAQILQRETVTAADEME